MHTLFETNQGIVSSKHQKIMIEPHCNVLIIDVMVQFMLSSYPTYVLVLYTRTSQILYSFTHKHNIVVGIATTAIG